MSKRKYFDGMMVNGLLLKERLENRREEAYDVRIKYIKDNNLIGFNDG